MGPNDVTHSNCNMKLWQTCQNNLTKLIILFSAEVGQLQTSVSQWSQDSKSRQDTELEATGALWCFSFSFLFFFLKPPTCVFHAWSFAVLVNWLIWLRSRNVALFLRSLQYLLLCPASVEASRVSGILYKITLSYPAWPCVNSCLEKEKKKLWRFWENLFFFPLLFAMFVPFYLLKQTQINVSLNLPNRPLGLHVSEVKVHPLFHHTANEAPDGNFLCVIHFIMLCYRHKWLNPNVTPSCFLATVAPSSWF